MDLALDVLGMVLFRAVEHGVDERLRCDVVRLGQLWAVGADGVVLGHEVGSGLDRYVPPAHGVSP
jgi:hypothetical protein